MRLNAFHSVRRNKPAGTILSAPVAGRSDSLASSSKNNCSAYGHGLTIDHYGAFVTIWIMVVRESGGSPPLVHQHISKNSTRGRTGVKDQTAATPAVPGNAPRASTRLGLRAQL